MLSSGMPPKLLISYSDQPTPVINSDPKFIFLYTFIIRIIQFILFNVFINPIYSLITPLTFIRFRNYVIF